MKMMIAKKKVLLGKKKVLLGIRGRSCWVRVWWALVDKSKVGAGG